MAVNNFNLIAYRGLPFHWKHFQINFLHCCDVIMGVMASQITSLTIVCSNIYAVVDRSKHQSRVTGFVRAIHRWLMTPPPPPPRKKHLIFSFKFHQRLFRGSHSQQLNTGASIGLATNDTPYLIQQRYLMAYSDIKPHWVRWGDQDSQILSVGVEKMASWYKRL